MLYLHCEATFRLSSIKSIGALIKIANNASEKYKNRGDIYNMYSRDK